MTDPALIDMTLSLILLLIFGGFIWVTIESRYDRGWLRIFITTITICYVLLFPLYGAYTLLPKQSEFNMTIMLVIVFSLFLIVPLLLSLIHTINEMIKDRRGESAEAEAEAEEVEDECVEKEPKAYTALGLLGMNPPRL